MVPCSECQAEEHSLYRFHVIFFILSDEVLGGDFFFQVIICIIVPTLDLSLGYSLQLEQRSKRKWYFAPAGPMLSN